MYTFNTKFSYNELAEYLAANTSRLKWFNLGILESEIKDKKLIMRLRKYNNVFQRIFVGKVEESETGTVITGDFHYPLTGVPFLIFWCAIVLSGEISALRAAKDLKSIIIPSLFFLLIAAIGAGIVLSGKLFNKKRETEIIAFLESISDEK